MQRNLRVGGQALGDGVFMRTERAWAIARADGTTETGVVAPNPVGRIPVLRVLVALAEALRLGIVRGLLGKRSGGRRPVRSKANSRFLYIVVASEAVVAGIAWLLSRLPVHGLVGSVVHALPVLGALVAMRFVAPATVWRYHGAEHKAVAAYEAGVDLDNLDAVMRCSRIHPRCGTNLVVLVAFIGVALQGQPAVVQFFGFLLGVAVSAEILTLAGRHPQSMVSRCLLAGGRVLQAYVTTQEPIPTEQQVACRALVAAVRHHERVTAEAEAVADPATDPAVADVPALDRKLVHR